MLASVIGPVRGGRTRNTGAVSCRCRVHVTRARTSLSGGVKLEGLLTLIAHAFLVATSTVIATRFTLGVLEVGVSFTNARVVILEKGESWHTLGAHLLIIA